MKEEVNELVVLKAFLSEVVHSRPLLIGQLSYGSCAAC